MRSLNSQVFNNMFIEILDRISDKIRREKASEGGLLAMALLQKLLPEGWDPPPFTHFKHIISDSNVGPEILELAQSLLQPGASLVTCQQALKNLKKLAHAFNFIDCVFHYKTEEAQKISQENLAIKILCANGIFTKLENVKDCHGNNQVITAPKDSSKNLPSPEYLQLMEVLQSLKDPDRIKAFLTALFDDMEPIEKNNEKMKALKEGIQDTFLLGNIETVIEMSNFYKVKYQEMIHEEAESRKLQDEDETSELTY